MLVSIKDQVKKTGRARTFFGNLLHVDTTLFDSIYPVGRKSSSGSFPLIVSAAIGTSP